MGLETEYANCKTLYVLPPAGYDTQESNVPVMVRIGRSSGKYRDDTSDVFEKLGASYLKMAVSLDDGVTECPVEVTEWDVDRQLGILFVKIPSVPTTGMTLKLWYDSTHADNTTNIGAIGSVIGQSVWANGFEGVWHMKPSGGLVLDSTANANHGTIHGATVTQGPLGTCLSFDGVDDYAALSSVPIPANHDITATAMHIPRGTDGRIYAEGNAALGHAIRQLSVRSDYAISWGSRNAQGVDSTLVGPYISEGYTSVDTAVESGINRILYSNEAAPVTDSWDTTYSSMDTASIGALVRSVPQYFYTGEIMFVSISSVARSPAWIALTNASLKDELIAFSAPGTESLTGNERMRLMPDGTLVADEFVEV